jgi:hypothetical protein
LLVTLASLVGGPAIFIHVAKQPSELVTRIAILSDAQITGRRNKFETYPLAWVGVAAIFAGIGASLTREWSSRKEREIDALLERRYGVFPPPPVGFLDRFRGGSSPPDNPSDA